MLSVQEYSTNIIYFTKSIKCKHTFKITLHIILLYRIYLKYLSALKEVFLYITKYTILLIKMLRLCRIRLEGPRMVRKNLELIR